MDWGDLRYGFHFDDDSLLNDQIDTKATFERDILVNDRQWFLRLAAQSRLAQFVH